MTAEPAFAPIGEAGAPLRVALIGAGDISKNHLIAWDACADASVAAICDRLEDRARARADAFAIPAVFDDAERMLAEIRPDVVDIATWRDSHGALIRLALAAGAPAILCQKPLAPTLAESVALVDEAKAAGSRLMVNENRRYAPPFQRIAEWSADGRVGAPRQVHMTMLRSGFLKGPDGSRTAIVRAPRMANEPRLLIAETFIHQLDVLRFLLGELTVIAARTMRTEPDMPGETLASLMMETRGGAPVLLSGSFVAPGFGAAVSDRLELIGAAASVILDGEMLTAHGAFTATERFDAKAVYQRCFDAAADAFAAALKNGAPFPQTAEDNLETLKLVEAAYAAADRN